MPIDKNEIVPSSEQSFTKRTLWEKIRGVDKEEKRLLELTEQVVKKLFKDISEEGRVSLFYKKNTGMLDTVICSVSLTSQKIPRLDVTLWNESVPPSQKSIDLHRELFGMTQHKRFISATEFSPSKTSRSIGVIQSWDMPEGSFVLNYRRNAIKETVNSTIPRSNKEKIKFLEEILQTTVNKTATAEPFGRPYVHGDTYGGGETSDGAVHHAYWVRDLKNKQISGFLNIGQPKLPQ